MDDKRVIQSYVSYMDKSYMVSTIERDSSALCSPTVRYNETIIWAYDWDTKERGEMLHMDEDFRGSIDTHTELCEKIYQCGIESILSGDNEEC